MIFFPMVWATAVPNRKGPTKWANAANPNALRGLMAPVAIMVATTFEAS